MSEVPEERQDPEGQAWGRHTVYGDGPDGGAWPVVGLTVEEPGNVTVWVGEGDFSTSDSGGGRGPQVMGVDAQGHRLVQYMDALPEKPRLIDVPWFAGYDSDALADAGQYIAVWAQMLLPWVGNFSYEDAKQILGILRPESHESHGILLLAWRMLHLQDGSID